MPITLRCDCGRALRVKDEFAGRKGRCPHCGTVLAIPAPEVEAEEDAYEVLRAEPETRVRRDPEPAYRRREPEPEPEPEPPRRPVLRREPSPRRRPRRAERGGPRVAFEEGWFGSANAGVVGGLLMILIAVVWFVAGLAAGYIFFYPPILFVIGIIAFIKGLSGN
jgi:hypothetical protein